jgi:LPS sulfotransferase NodH
VTSSRKPGAVADVSCVITSLPRSGSWLLASGLQGTGCAGRPEEYLRPELEVRYARDWSLAAGHTVEQFWAAMLAAGTSSNGVFGVKIHWQDCARLLRRARAAGRAGSDRAVLESVFPNPRYIHIVRRNTLAQAVSWCRALDSGRWWVTNGIDPAESIPWDPDFDEIALLEDLLVDHEHRWQTFFANNGITPHQVVYEDLVENYAPIIRGALDHLGVDPTGSVTISAPSLRRQADQLSERWVTKYRQLQRAIAPERAPRQRTDTASVQPARHPVAPDMGAGPYRSLRSVLAPHPWTYATQPFPHVVARQVFRDSAYADVDRAFSEVLDVGLDGSPAGFARATPGYDVFSHTMRAGLDGPFALFCSRPWHDLLAGVTGITGSGHTFCGLHHHAVGSASGSVHNDLNPGFFPRRAARSEVVLNDHTQCAYHGGGVAPGVDPVETVRGVALIFFVHNQDWHPGDGGEIGLYRHAGDAVDDPAVAVPPLNNSMVLFECTPHSYHAFIGNRRIARNSLIMWIHRPVEDVVARWGRDAIITWPQG